jgi:hypothetical protein
MFESQWPTIEEMQARRAARRPHERRAAHLMIDEVTGSRTRELAGVVRRPAGAILRVR